DTVLLADLSITLKAVLSVGRCSASRNAGVCRDRNNPGRFKREANWRTTMKKIVLVSALGSATMLSAPAAFAFGPSVPPYGTPNAPPPPPTPSGDLPCCDTL